MPMNIFETLEPRLPASQVDTPLARHLGACKAVHGHLTTKRSELARNSGLSAVGRRDALRKYAGENTSQAVARARDAVESARADLKRRHDGLRPRARDPKDSVEAAMRGRIL